MKICCLCDKEVNEDAAVLTISGYGKKKLLCQECENSIDAMTLSRDTNEIEGAIRDIANKLSYADPNDSSVIMTTNDLLQSANDRLEKIKKNEYDFSLDETEYDEYDIPEEMLESEEDKLLDEEDEKKNKKLDSIINIVFIAVLVGLVAWFIISRFV